MAEAILVVDDEKKIRDILNIQLSSEGFEVFRAESGEEALNILEEKEIDVVVSDIMMPKTGGQELLEKVEEKFEITPVIMLTGKVNVEDAVEIMKAGAFDYLIKPVKKKNLILTLNKALDYKKLQEEKKALERKNREYRKELEKKVEEKTADLKRALSHLRRVHLDTVRALTKAIEAKDPYLDGHSYRVSQYALKLGESLGLSDEELERLEFGSLLHDIGKISISNRILHKKSSLNEEERKAIQKHPIIGERIIKGISYFDGSRPFIRYHHERFDGKGYPEGLEEDEIPELVPLLSLVDAFDAMASNRPYRDALPLNKILEIVKEEKGSQFHPRVVEKFLEEEIYNIDIS